MKHCCCILLFVVVWFFPPSFVLKREIFEHENLFSIQKNKNFDTKKLEDVFVSKSLRCKLWGTLLVRSRWMLCCLFHKDSGKPRPLIMMSECRILNLSSEDTKHFHEQELKQFYVSSGISGEPSRNNEKYVIQDFNWKLMPWDFELEQKLKTKKWWLMNDQGAEVRR